MEGGAGHRGHRRGRARGRLCGPAHRAEPVHQGGAGASGELRAALFTGNPVIAGKNRETGELSGTAFMLGRALAADAGVGFAPIEYTTIARLMDDAKTGAWDVAVLAIDPARRAVIDYAPPYVVVDITYLVRPGSPIASVAEADRPGVRVTAARGAATALMLQRTLKNAQLTPADSEPAAFELIREGKADAYAQNRFMLLGLADRLPGARVLDDRLDVVQLALALPKGRPTALAYVTTWMSAVGRPLGSASASCTTSSRSSC